VPICAQSVRPLQSDEETAPGDPDDGVASGMTLIFSVATPVYALHVRLPRAVARPADLTPALTRARQRFLRRIFSLTVRFCVVGAPVVGRKLIVTLTVSFPFRLSTLVAARIGLRTTFT
jgi:hypothetical protein